MAEELKEESYNDIFDKTFVGIGIFYRDTTLSEELSGRYEPGQIITERGFTDMTYVGGGVNGNTRYLIASARGTDISQLSPTNRLGHVILPPMAVFKVLDIFPVGNYKQIFLLQIPPEAADFFAEMSSNVEDDLIETARENFKRTFHEPVAAEFKDADWKGRTAPPLGMNELGEFF